MITCETLQPYIQKLNTVREFSALHMGNLPYHNRLHVEDVVSSVTSLARLELGISPHDAFMLITAAYLHDIVDNEEKSVLVARTLLGGLNYSSREIEQVGGLILATKMPTRPNNLLEEIICDADVDNLGRGDFLDKNNAVREELLSKGLISKDLASWYAKSIEFLQSHKYYTISARILRNEGKQKNIERLKQLLNEITEKNKS